MKKQLKPRKNKKVKKFVVDKREVDASIKRTLQGVGNASLGGRAAVRKKKRKEKHDIQEVIEEQKQFDKEYQNSSN